MRISRVTDPQKHDVVQEGCFKEQPTNNVKCCRDQREITGSVHWLWQLENGPSKSRFRVMVAAKARSQGSELGGSWDGEWKPLFEETWLYKEEEREKVIVTLRCKVKVGFICVYHFFVMRRERRRGIKRTREREETKSFITNFNCHWVICNNIKETVKEVIYKWLTLWLKKK